MIPLPSWGGMGEGFARDSSGLPRPVNPCPATGCVFHSPRCPKQGDF